MDISTFKGVKVLEWSARDQPVITLWSNSDQPVIRQWSANDQPLISQSSISGQPVINHWSNSDYPVISPSSAFDQSVIIQWPTSDQPGISHWSSSDQPLTYWWSSSDQAMISQWYSLTGRQLAMTMLPAWPRNKWMNEPTKKKQIINRQTNKHSLSNQLIKLARGHFRIYFWLKADRFSKWTGSSAPIEL